MKNSFFLVLSLLFLSLTSNAQKGENTSSDNPREDRKIAITTESAVKNLSGFGLNLSYYITPKIAIDVGGGLGAQLIKGGIRGRYLFFNQRFTPYVGASLFFAPLSFDDIQIEGVDSTFDIDVTSSTYGQLLVGIEFMGKRGFVIGGNLGYSQNFKERVWSTDETISSFDESILDILYGSGISAGFNIGFAF